MQVDLDRELPITMLEKGAIETTTPEIAAIPKEQLDDASERGTGDDALDFLKQHGSEGHFAHDASRMRRLRQRIDIRVIPFLAFSYLANYLDKILLNVRSSASARSIKLHD